MVDTSSTFGDDLGVDFAVGTTTIAFALKENITKTALITVGYFLGSEYDRSELYNPTFAHGYREADPSKLNLKPEVK